MNFTARLVLLLSCLQMAANLMSAQLQQDITNNKITAKPTTNYFKREIQGGSIVDLMYSRDLKEVGKNSFDANRLNQGRGFIFDRISLTYASDAASGKETVLDYKGTNLPVELKNAFFTIKQNGRIVLELPVRDIVNQSENAINSEDRYIYLVSAQALNDQHAITAQITFPEGVSLPTSVKHYICLELSGIETQTTPVA